MEEKRNYYAILSADVRYCKAITNGAKLLYAEITALCNSEGYCWATNRYFANLYEINVATVSVWISSLEKEGFIRIDSGHAEGNRRKIYLNFKKNQPELFEEVTEEVVETTPSLEKSKEGIEKNLKTSLEKSKEGIEKNLKTSLEKSKEGIEKNLKTSLEKSKDINNTSNTKENIKSDGSCEETQNDNHDFFNCKKEAQQLMAIWGRSPGNNGEYFAIEKLLNDYTFEELKKAFYKVAERSGADKGKLNLAYVRGVAKGMREDAEKQKAKEDEAKYKAEKEKQKREEIAFAKSDEGREAFRNILKEIKTDIYPEKKNYTRKAS
ncbi:MAG: helix-turn-helix domain-containing protein [Candidatus Kapaibacterium sp.]